MFTRFIDYWWAWMAAMSWQVGVVALLIGVVALAARRLSARWHYLLWLLVFVKLALPPQWGHEYSPTAVAARYWTRPAATMMPARALPVAPMPAVAADPTSLPADAPAPAVAVHAASSAHASPTVSVAIAWPRARTMLFWLWATGVAFLIARASWARRRFAVALRQRATPPCEAMQAELQAAARNLSLRRPLRACMVDGLSAPCVLGWLRPSLVLPGARLLDMSPVQRGMVLEHELSHIRRFDPLVNGLANLLAWAYWFHPLAWWAERQLRLAREMAVDEGIALAHGVQKYGETLLVMARSRPGQALPASVGLGEAGSPLALRVRRLALHPPRRHSLGATLLLALGLGVLACTGLPLAAPKAPRSNASSFDGVHDFVRIDPSASLDLRSSLTLSARIRVDNDDHGNIFWRGDLRGGLDPYQMNVTDHRIEFRVDSEPTDHFVRSSQPVDDRWHFWTGVYDVDAGRLLLYCDGVLNASEGIEGRIDYDTAQMWNIIGACDDGGWAHFRGEIAEIQLWNEARSARQIQADMKRRLRRGASGLAGWWVLSDSKDGVVADRSGNGADGKLQWKEGNTALSSSSASDVYWDHLLKQSTEAGAAALPDFDVPDLPGFGKGLKLHGRDTFVEIGAQKPMPSIKEALTAELWLYLPDYPKNYFHLASKWGPALDEDDTFSWKVGSNGTMEVELNPSPQDWSPNTRLVTSEPVPLRQWTHIAFAWSGAEHRLAIYMDGRQVARTDAAFPTLTEVSEPWRLGTDAYKIPGYLLRAAVAELRLWNVERSEPEVAADRERRGADETPGQIGHWIFDAVHDGYYPDHSGIGNPARLRGPAS